MNQLRPNSQRAKIAIIFIWIVLVINIISLISSCLQLNLLNKMDDGISFSPDVLEGNDSREVLIGLIYGISMIISAVMFIRWFRRAYFNLHLLVKPLSFSEGWASGSWFVPVICLFRPYQIMKELYVETEQFITKNRKPYNLSTKFVGIWWTFWVISNVVGNIVFRYSKNADTISKLQYSSIGSIIDCLISIPLAFLAIKVIKDYSKVEELLPIIQRTEEPKPFFSSTNQTNF